MYTLRYTFRGLSDILSQNQQHRLAEYLEESNIALHISTIGAFEQSAIFTFYGGKPEDQDILSLGMLIGSIKGSHD